MKYIMITLLAGIVLVGCSKERKFAKRIDGVWAVEQLSLTPGNSEDVAINAKDIGTIEFNESGHGKNNFAYSYEVEGETIAVNDNEAFTWTYDDEMISITGNSNSGEQKMTWAIDDNDKDTQLWSRTDHKNNYWEMILTRR